MLLRRAGNKSEGWQSYESLLCWQVATAGGKGRMTMTPLFDDVTSAHKSASIHPSLHHALSPPLHTNGRTHVQFPVMQTRVFSLSVWEIELRPLRVRVCGRTYGVRGGGGVIRCRKEACVRVTHLFFRFFSFLLLRSFSGIEGL